jgi:hypothetical protein
MLQAHAPKTKPTCLGLAGGSIYLILDECYTMIAQAPNRFMPRQHMHMQHIIRPVWQHDIMVKRLYLTSPLGVNEIQPPAHTRQAAP